MIRFFLYKFWMSLVLRVALCFPVWRHSVNSTWSMDPSFEGKSIRAAFHSKPLQITYGGGFVGFVCLLSLGQAQCFTTWLVVYIILSQTQAGTEPSVMLTADESLVKGFFFPYSWYCIPKVIKILKLLKVREMETISEINASPLSNCKI